MKMYTCHECLPHIFLSIGILRLLFFIITHKLREEGQSVCQTFPSQPLTEIALAPPGNSMLSAASREKI